MKELASLAHVAGGSLADSVHAAIRDGIADGSLSPGYRLREVELADHFGVSTTPVREALRRLEHEGLVTSSPRRGASVAPMAWAEMHELLAVRELLEVYAVRQAAGKGPQKHPEIRELLRRSAKAAKESDHKIFSQLDLEFHMAVIKLSGNRPLARFAELAHLQLQRTRLRTAVGRPGTLTESQRQHAAMLDAIEAGDPDAAESALHTHVKAVKKGVAKLIAALPGEDGQES